MPNKFSIKYLLISTPFLHNQKFIFLFYISAKINIPQIISGTKPQISSTSPSSCNTLVHNTKNLRIMGVYQRIILAIVHLSKRYSSPFTTILAWSTLGILQIGQPTTLGSSTIYISGASQNRLTDFRCRFSKYSRFLTSPELAFDSSR